MHIYKRKLKPRIDTRRQQGVIPAVEECASAFEPARGRIMASGSFSPEEIARLNEENEEIATKRLLGRQDGENGEGGDDEEHDYATDDAEHVDLDSRLAIGGNEIVRLKVDICHRLGKWEHHRRHWSAEFIADRNLANEMVFLSWSEFDNISEQISEWHKSHHEDLQKIVENPPPGFTRDIELVMLIGKVESWSEDHMLVFAFYVGWVVSFGWLRATADASLPGIRAGGARAGAKGAAPGRRLRGLVGC